jgi:hypothetical protein
MLLMGHEEKSLVLDFLKRLTQASDLVELQYLQAEAKELEETLKIGINMKAQLMQKDYLLEVTTDGGESYGVEITEDVQTPSGSSMAIWDETGSQMRKTNPLYDSIVKAVEEAILANGKN